MDEKRTRRHRNPDWKGTIGLFLFVGLFAAGWIYSSTRPYPFADKDTCLTHQRNIAVGFQMYASDHGDYFPAATRWQDAIQPYIKDTETFRCPVAQAKVTAFAFNARLDRKRRGTLAENERMVLIFESDKDIRNASGDASLLVSSTRHHGGNNFTFTDGEAKWYRDGNAPGFGTAQ